MIKKFFRNLTLSSDEKRRERAQDSLHRLAKSLDAANPQLAKMVRLFAMAKLEFDSFESLHQAGEKQGVDFDELCESVCERAQDKVAEIAKLEQKMSSVFGAADKSKLAAHTSEWNRGIEDLHCAYGSLKRAASQKLSSELEQLTNQPDTSKPLGQAVEALLLEVRTVERIRSELGG